MAVELNFLEIVYRIATRTNERLYSVQATCTAWNLKRGPWDQAKGGSTGNICQKEGLKRGVVWKVQKDGLLPSVFAPSWQRFSRHSWPFCSDDSTSERVRPCGSICLFWREKHQGLPLSPLLKQIRYV